MRVLVISGGSSKGAFACGAIKYLLQDRGIIYDSYCGVSCGAINSAFLSMFPTGDEKLASDTLRSLWQGISSKDIYREWYLLGIFQTIWRNSFYNTAPLRKLIRSNISLDKIRSSGKKVAVGAVSLTSGKYRTFTEADDDFIDAIIASSAFPVIFEPIKFRGELWVDGGQKSITPLATAIDMGATIVDVIMTSPEIRDKKFMDNPSTIDIIARSFDLFTEKIMSSDIEKAVLYNKLAALGGTSKKAITMNIIRPTYNLVENMLDFDPAKIQEMMDVGYNQAKLVFEHIDI